MSKITRFASESVCAGHPDKIADQISDAILDALLVCDPQSRTAVEVLVAKNRIVLAGEVKTNAMVNFAEIAREQIGRLGYVEPAWGFSDQSPVENYIHAQSSEIGMGVDEYGAGDQGLMFGYACLDTPEFMPLPIALAHALTRALDTARERRELPYLRPDGKAQVVVRYKDDVPVAVEHVTIATAHNEEVQAQQVHDDVYEQVVLPVLKRYGHSIAGTDVVVNGTGLWHIPGPASDAGLTGRKIVVDGYGGFARVGGGAFSGKDPSKVDRSGAYAARYLAKNIVAAGLAQRAEVALAYYIGAKEPVLFTIDTFGTSTRTEKELYGFAKGVLVPSVRNIIQQLDLCRAIYLQTATYGHFGRPDLPWEKIKET